MMSRRLGGPSLVVEGALLAAVAAWEWTRWLPQLRTLDTGLVLVVVAAGLLATVAVGGATLVVGLVVMLRAPRSLVLVGSVLQVPLLLCVTGLSTADANPGLFVLGGAVILATGAALTVSLLADRRR
jgi:hypothetical protein